MSASRKSRRRSGRSALCTTTWGSLITRQVASSVPQTRSGPDCYPCLRKKMRTICPVRTLKELARLNVPSLVVITEQRDRGLNSRQGFATGEPLYEVAYPCARLRESQEVQVETRLS